MGLDDRETTGSNEEIQAFFKKANKGAKYILRRNKVINEQAQKILGLPGFAEAVVRIRKTISKGNSNTLSSAKELMSGFDIETKWLAGLRAYLASGDEEDLKAPLSVIVRQAFDEQGLLKELSLVLSKDATQEDVTAVWDEVEKLQTKLPGRVKKKNVLLRNLDRDKEMLALKSGGMTYREIGEKFGLDYDQVSTIFRNIRRRTGKSAS